MESDGQGRSISPKSCGDEIVSEILRIIWGDCDKNPENIAEEISDHDSSDGDSIGTCIDTFDANHYFDENFEANDEAMEFNGDGEPRTETVLKCAQEVGCSNEVIEVESEVHPSCGGDNPASAISGEACQDEMRLSLNDNSPICGSHDAVLESSDWSSKVSAESTQSKSVSNNLEKSSLKSSQTSLTAGERTSRIPRAPAPQTNFFEPSRKNINIKRINALTFSRNPSNVIWPGRDMSGTQKPPVKKQPSVKELEVQLKNAKNESAKELSNIKTNYEAKIKQLEQTIKSMEAADKKKSGEYNTSLDKNYDKLRLELSSKTKEIECLKENVNHQKCIYKTFTKTVAEKEREQKMATESLNKQLEESSRREKDTKKKLADVSAKLADVSVKLTESTSRRKSEDETSREFTLLYENVKQKNQDLEDSLKAAKTRISKLQSELQELRGTILKNNCTRPLQESMIKDGLDEIVAKKNNELEALGIKNHSQKQKIRDLKRKVVELKNEVKLRIDHLAAWERELKTREDRIYQQNNVVKVKNDLIAMLRKDFSKLECQRNSLCQMLGEAREESATVANVKMSEQPRSHRNKVPMRPFEGGAMVIVPGF